MVYTGANLGGSDGIQSALGSHYTEHLIPEANHTDLHDAAVVLPILRWFGGLPVRRAASVKQEMAAAIAEFLNGAGNSATVRNPASMTKKDQSRKM
jgi:hypothetical protein